MYTSNNLLLLHRELVDKVRHAKWSRKIRYLGIHHNENRLSSSKMERPALIGFDPLAIKMRAEQIVGRYLSIHGDKDPDLLAMKPTLVTQVTMRLTQRFFGDDRHQDVRKDPDTKVKEPHRPASTGLASMNLIWVNPSQPV